MSYSHVVLFYGLLPLATAASGCQRGPEWKLSAVEGSVSKAGQPLAEVEVVYWADVDAGTTGPRASGTTDEAGHYRLKNDNGADGAVVGKHRVVLADGQTQAVLSLLSAQKKGRPQLPPETVQQLHEAAARPPRLPLSYGSFKDTPLRIEVQPGPQVIDLEVK